MTMTTKNNINKGTEVAGVPCTLRSEQVPAVFQQKKQLERELEQLRWHPDLSVNNLTVDPVCKAWL